MVYDTWIIDEEVSGTDREKPGWPNMNIVATENLYTPSDLLTMPEGDRYELVDGRLVENTMSLWSCYVAGRMHQRLHTFSEANHLGWVLPEGTTYQCFPHHPNKVRKADVSFIRLGRISLEVAFSEGPVSIAPDLAVEVVSPNDLVYEVDSKVQEYLTAGVKLVWMIHPRTRTVAVHRPGGQGTILRETDELDGEGVIPGFRCSVAELFLPPAGSGANGKTQGTN